MNTAKSEGRGNWFSQSCLPHFYAAAKSDTKARNNIFTLLLTALFISKFNLVNIFYSSEFSYTYPPVDIIPILSDTKSLPEFSFSNHTNQNYTFTNELLVDLLQDIYLRKEENYLGHMNNTTIVVQPKVIWNRGLVLVSLREGFHNLDTKGTTFTKLTVTAQIAKSAARRRSIFDLSQPGKSSDSKEAYTFLHQIISTLFYFTGIPSISYDIDILQKLIFLQDVSTCWLLITSFAVFIISSILLSPILMNKVFTLALSLCGAIFLTTNIGFSMFSMVLLILINTRFPNWKSILLIFYYLFQAMAATALLYYLFIDYDDSRQQRKQLDVMSEFASSPTITPQPSSYYEGSIDINHPNELKVVGDSTSTKSYNGLIGNSPVSSGANIQLPHTIAHPPEDDRMQESSIKRCLTAPARSDVMARSGDSFDSFDFGQRKRRNTVSRFTEQGLD
ncbi:uncharacterized protein RJT20DRAFT_139429 [Scheffersomyces xylosifermentans]|uniref:uncharacterized protein n=1 Tax=Scheffersomyces xylosifermentans TaxID=1304137 RepID=UPI00315D1005